MKRLVLFCALFYVSFFNTLLPADKPRDQSEGQYVVAIPFDYEKHGKAALELVRNDMHRLASLPQEMPERQREIDRLLHKLDAMMHNNTIMSATKIIQNSFYRAVITDGKDVVVGMIDGFQRADDGKGYIETICTNPAYNEDYPILIK